MTHDEDIADARPEGLTQVLNAAERLLAKMERRLERPVRPGRRRRRLDEVMLQSADVMMEYLGHVDTLCADIDELNFVLYGTPPEERDVPAAMARIEAHIDAVLNRHRNIRGWRTVGPDGAEGRDILVAIYRHLLRELENWLRDIVFTLSNPLDALMEQGNLLVPGSFVRLKMKVYFATPPEMSALEAWAQRCMRRRNGAAS